MEYIRVTKENLEKEHICCAISRGSGASHCYKNVEPCNISLTVTGTWFGDENDRLFL